MADPAPAALFAAGLTFCSGASPVLPTLIRSSAGYIKKAIQSKLHMPETTATRRIHEIYAALGVETLFQAGVAAHRRGWVK